MEYLTGTGVLKLAPCPEKLVPMTQRAQVDYLAFLTILAITAIQVRVGNRFVYYEGD